MKPTRTTSLPLPHLSPAKMCTAAPPLRPRGFSAARRALHGCQAWPEGQCRSQEGGFYIPGRLQRDAFWWFFKKNWGELFFHVFLELFGDNFWCTFPRHTPALCRRLPFVLSKRIPGSTPAHQDDFWSAQICFEQLLPGAFLIHDKLSIASRDTPAWLLKRTSTNEEGLS